MSFHHKPLIIHLTFSPTLGGGEIQLQALTTGLGECGLSQAVMCLESSALASYFQQSHPSDIKVYAIRQRWLDSLRCLRQLYRQYPNIILHAHDAKAHTLALFSLLFLRQQYPLIVSRKVAFPLKKKWLSAWKYQHALVKKIICVSSAVQQEILKYLKNSEKTLVIPDGIALDAFSSPPKEILRTQYTITEPWLVGMIAALVPIKDHETFIRMAKFLKDQGVHAKFLIIGCGRLQSGLQALATRLQLSNDIIFTGQRHDIAEIIGELDCLVLTSKSEGLGRVLLEAMAAKVPIVASATSGIRDLIHHGKNGLLAEVGEPEDFANKVRLLLTNPDYAQRLAEQAKQLVTAFSNEQMIQRTLAVYQTFLKKVSSS